MTQQIFTRTKKTCIMLKIEINEQKKGNNIEEINYILENTQ